MAKVVEYSDEDTSPSVNDEGSDSDEVEGVKEALTKQDELTEAVDDKANQNEEVEHDDEDEENEYSNEGCNENYSEDYHEDPLQHQEDYGEYADEGELTPDSKAAAEEFLQDKEDNKDRRITEEQADRNGLEEEEEVAEERVLPQEVTTPFSLASFLSSVAPQITDDAASQDTDSDQEFTYVKGAYARVVKTKVDMGDLDRRLDNLREQRKEEIGLLKMYGLDDREDRGGDRGGRSDDRDSRGGRDRGRNHDSRRRSGSRSRDRDRRSRSRERRRSRSRDRQRSRSRSRDDKPSRRDRDSPERSRGRDDKDRFGRDRDRFGRDRDDRDKFGRDKDRHGRDKDRFGRDRRDRSRDKDWEDKKDDREHKRSKSPRSERQDNNRNREFGSEEDDHFNKAGWGGSSSRQSREHSSLNTKGQGQKGKLRNEDRQEQTMYGDQRGREGTFPGMQDSSYSGGQDFFSKQPSFQPPPLPVPPPEPFPQGQFQGSQTGGFNAPPPPLDPFSSSVPPPQPWMGSGFQQQQAPPPPPQQPPPPSHMLVSTVYSQLPPPPPANVGLQNNGDLNNPAMGGAQGYGTTAQNPSQPPPAMGERFPGLGMDTGYSDTGTIDESEPMDLDLPDEGADDYQSRVVGEVKNAIRPYFTSRQITKDDYKEILKKCVPKVSSSGEINPKKIGNLVGAYVKKIRGAKSK